MSQPTRSNPADVIRQLQAQGDPASLARAAELQALHYDRQMARLCGDVYESAKGVGEPDPGWTRASEDPEQLAAIAQQLGIDAKQLRDMLRPDDSGFRAEIYLPDPAVLGPGFKPVLVFKGSTGEIQDPGNKRTGLRDPSAEDFVANNFPQSIGLKSDYYTRAMGLGKLLKDKGFDFDLAGHSLGGGMASAASVVTGVRATTYNAAGLHPKTAVRFAEDNPGTVLHDPQHTVTAYQIRGEVLNDGLQYNIDRLDRYRRDMLAGTLSDAAFLMRNTPYVKEEVEKRLLPGMPKKAQEATVAFLEELASGDAKAMLRDLPLAVGKVKQLDMPMMRQNPNDPNSPLVPRPEVLEMDDLARLATPTLAAARAAMAAAKMGNQLGEVPAKGTEITNKMLNGVGAIESLKGVAQGQLQHATLSSVGVATGAIIQTQSAAVQTLRKGMGEGHASLVEGAVALESTMQRAIGGTLQKASRWIPNVFGAREWMEQAGEQMHARADALEQRGERVARNAREAARADAVAVRDAADIVTLETVTVTAKMGHDARAQHVRAGMESQRAWDDMGDAIARLGRIMQSGMTISAGGVVVGIGAGQFPIRDDFRNTVEQGVPAGKESADRHGMGPTVIPTFDRQMQQMLDKAQRQVHDAPEQGQPARPLPEQQAARGFSAADQALFDRIRGAVPGHVDDAVIGHAVVQVKRSGMLEMGGMAGVTLREDRLFIAGATAGFRVSVDVREPVADLQNSQHAAATLDRQQTQERAAAVPRTQDAPVFA